MKVGIAGKGGTGKTALAALLAQSYLARGRRVLAVDTDSDPNLGLSLGLDRSELADVSPLPRSLTTGRADGDMTTSELVDAYAVTTPAGPLLLHAVGVLAAGAGCACGNHMTVNSLLGETTEREADLTVVDMEAGLEHLSRAGGTLAYADVLVVVMEPTGSSVLTAVRTRELAAELGIPRVYPVGNKVGSDEEAAWLREEGAAREVAPVAIVPHDATVADADRDGTMIALDDARSAAPALDDLIRVVESPEERRAALKRELERLDRRLGGLQDDWTTDGAG